MSSVICVYCEAGTYTADDQSKCLLCLNSYSVARSANITSCVCNAGWTGMDGVCTGCVAGKYKTNPGSIACTACVAGKYLGVFNASKNTCTNCTAGSYSAYDRSECVLCVNAYSVAGSADITFCVCNAGSMGIRSNCTACVAGKYLPTQESVVCADCAAGKYSKISAVSCVACAAGSYSAHDRSECVLCVNAYSVAESVNSTYCVCNAGWTGTDNDCNACVAGKYKANTGSEACSDCAPGKFSVHVNSTSNTCIYCIAGSYSSSTKGYCVACVAGKYKNITWSMACTDCGAGKYSDVLHAATDTCRECAAGLYSYHDRSKCVSCPANSYSKARGDTIASCNCNAGWSGQNGDCFACVPGKYKTSDESVACTNCAAGKYSDVVNASTDTCRACAAGLYSYHDGSKCVSCPANSFSPAQSDSCQVCVPNSYSAVGSAECYCNAGWTRTHGGCAACVPGTYKFHAGDAACIDCAAGMSSNASATNCTDCAAGLYSTDDMLLCHVCMENSSSAAGSAECSCNAGWSGTHSDCAACMPGKYSPNPGSATCTDCVKDSYSTDNAANDASQCHSCPVGLYSGAGSGSITQCSLSQCGVGGQRFSVDVAQLCNSSTGVGPCNVFSKDPDPDSKYGAFNLLDGVMDVVNFNGIYRATCASCAWGLEVSTTVIDLGKEYEISHVGIWSGSQWYLGGLQLFLSDSRDSQSPSSCSNGKQEVCSYGIPAALHQNVNCGPGVSGRFLCMKKLDYKMYMLEVKVFVHSHCACGEGSFPTDNNARCWLCPVNTNSASGDTVCSCNPGWFGTADACVACEAGTYKPTPGSDQCIDCAARESSQTSAHICVCMAGLSRINGICVDCVAGKYKPSIGDDVCIDCDNAIISNTSTFRCTQCAVGYYPIRDRTRCEICMPGTATCVECEHDFYITSSKTRCAKCPAYTYSAAGIESITECTSSQCGGGTQVTVAGAFSHCSCAAGFYSTSDRLRCAACPGSLASAVGSAAVSDCACHPGLYVSNNDCLQCPAGTSQASFGTSACMPCGAGMYSGPSAASCDYCAENSYAADDKSTCLPCGPHSTSVRASDDITFCMCNAGWSGSNGDCTGCVAGKYKPAPGSAACMPCGAGMYSGPSAASCDYCAENAYSADDKSTCLPCGPNSTSVRASDNNTFCICNAAWSGSNGDCTGCVAGKYKPAPGSAACTDCGTGEDSHAVAIVCGCAAGWKGTIGSCLGCVSGTYKPNIGSGKCTTCAAGKHASTTSAACVDAMCDIQNNYWHTRCGLRPSGDYYDRMSGLISTGGPPFHPEVYKNNDPYDNNLDCRWYIKSYTPVSLELWLLATEPNMDYLTIYKCTEISCWDGERVDLLRISGMSTGTAAGMVYTNSPGYPYLKIIFRSYVKSFTDPWQYRSRYHGVRMNWWSDPVSDYCGCPLNMYMGPVKCTQCPSNSHSPRNSTAVAACICPAGWTGTDGSSCSPCAGGTWKPDTGNSPCLGCAANTDSPSGSVSPTACYCKAGFWASTVDATGGVQACTQCPVNSHSPSASVSPAACTCNPGLAGGMSTGARVCAVCNIFGEQPHASRTHCESRCGSTGTLALVNIAQQCGDAGAAGRCEVYAQQGVDIPGTSFSKDALLDGVIRSHLYGGLYVTGCTSCRPWQSTTVIDLKRRYAVRYVKVWAGIMESMIGGAVFSLRDTMDGHSPYSCGNGPANVCTPWVPHALSQTIHCASGAVGRYFCIQKTGETAMREIQIFGFSHCQCGADFYSTNGRMDCAPCPQHSVSAHGSVAPEACSCMPNWTGAAGACAACAPGIYKFQAGPQACSDCIGNKQFRAATGSCECLRAGQVLNASTDSCTCLAGWRETADTCAACAPGKYKPNAGAAECLPCGERLTSAAAASFCICIAGWTRPDGVCVRCLPGTYKPDDGFQACSRCAAGTHSNASAVACAGCAAGSYSADDRSACVRCPTNSFSAVASHDIGYCVCDAPLWRPE